MDVVVIPGRTDDDVCSPSNVFLDETMDVEESNSRQISHLKPSNNQSLVITWIIITGDHSSTIVINLSTVSNKVYSCRRATGHNRRFDDDDDDDDDDNDADDDDDDEKLCGLI